MKRHTLEQKLAKEAKWEGQVWTHRRQKGAT
jgi:hypothetical protein